MTVTPTGQADYSGAIIQQSHASRGQALIQLLHAFNDAVRAEVKPLSNIAEVNRIDISA
ncbi:MAG: hypothetical protein WCX65_05175 [bacterium]